MPPTGSRQQSELGRWHGQYLKSPFGSRQQSRPISSSRQHLILPMESKRRSEPGRQFLMPLNQEMIGTRQACRAVPDTAVRSRWRSGLGRWHGQRLTLPTGSRWRSGSGRPRGQRLTPPMESGWRLGRAVLAGPGRGGQSLRHHCLPQGCLRTLVEQAWVEYFNENVIPVPRLTVPCPWQGERNGQLGDIGALKWLVATCRCATRKRC